MTDEGSDAPSATTEDAARAAQAAGAEEPAALETGPFSAQRLEELIERWWGDHFPGSPVAQLTSAWNHTHAAKEELKRRLRAL